MRQCIRCKDVKYRFQFYSQGYGLYSRYTEICKACADILKDRAVEEEEERFKAKLAKLEKLIKKK